VRQTGLCADRLHPSARNRPGLLRQGRQCVEDRGRVRRLWRPAIIAIIVAGVEGPTASPSVYIIKLQGEPNMSRIPITGLAAMPPLAFAATTQAQQQQPQFAATKVDGTDNVYIFRYVGHQSMFIVTPEGVIATDPIGERRPAAQAYIAEIKKITNAPIRYVI